MTNLFPVCVVNLACFCDCPPSHMESSPTHGRCLGVGAKGSVFLGFNRNNGHLVAVKELSLPTDETTRTEEVAAIANEVTLMKSFAHPCLVAYLGVRSAGSNRIHILMEYVPGGSLGKLVSRFGPLSEKVAKLFMRDVLSALEYLHNEKHVCHRDVKPDNIMVTADGRCKLGDFGTGRTLHSDLPHDDVSLSTCVGTPAYMAPEVLEGKGYGSKADIWGVGMTLYELLSGASPFAHCANPYAVMYRLSEGDVPELPSEIGLSPQGLDFLRLCLMHDPCARPTAGSLLHHLWLSTVEHDTDANVAEMVIMAQAPRPGSHSGSSQSASPARSPPRGTHNDPPQSDSHRESLEGSLDEEGSTPYPCHRCGASAAFECDDCRRVFGRLYRVCPSCWEPIHTSLPRGRYHVKRPLLLDGTATPGVGGVLLESGAYVDLCCSEGEGWRCGRCGSFNGVMSPSCGECNHLR